MMEVSLYNKKERTFQVGTFNKILAEKGRVVVLTEFSDRINNGQSHCHARTSVVLYIPDSSPVPSWLKPKLSAFVNQSFQVIEEKVALVVEKRIRDFEKD